METKERLMHLFKAALVGAAFFMVVWWDVSSQMKFTEATRAGIYEQASKVGAQ